MSVAQSKPSRAEPTPQRHGPPRAPRRVAWLGALGLLACDGDGPDGPAATVLAEIQVQAWCDRVDVEQIVLRARALECLPDAPECGASDIEGDRISCPVTSPMALMGVDVAVPARYAVAVERIRSAGGPEVECVASEAGSTTWEIGPEAIASSSQLAAAPGLRMCPQP